MSQLIQLRQRIKAIGSTQKVTHAMRLLSIASYGKLKLPLIPFKEYQQALKANLSRLTLSQGYQGKQSYQHSDNTNPLIMVISSSRGLCGSFHNNLARYCETKLAFRRDQQPRFIAIGKKTKAFIIEKMEEQHVEEFEILVEHPMLTEKLIPKITANIADLFLKNLQNFSSFRTISMEFNNLFSQTPTITTISPIEYGNSTDESEHGHVNYIWQEPPEVILKKLRSMHISTSIHSVLSESLLSETAARFVAMDGATSNAKKHIDDLTLKYNKLRQALITREVAELSANPD